MSITPGSAAQQPGMLSAVFRCLWLLLHTLNHCYCWLRGTWLHYLRLVASHCEPATAGGQRDRQLIAKCRADLQKLPQHIAVILSESGADGRQAAEAAEADALSRLIRWVEYTGIGHLSFYDYRGHIEDVRPELYAKVCAYQQQNRPSTNGLSPASAANGAHKIGNGTSNGSIAKGASTNGFAHSAATSQSQEHPLPPVAVHLIDPQLNRTHLVEVSRKLCTSASIAPQQIDIPLVDAAVRQALHQLPEPELAFHFDEHCCTYGLSPWQIRLTEFVRLERNVGDLRLASYLGALYKYSKCEQRFGK